MARDGKAPIRGPLDGSERRVRVADASPQRLERVVRAASPSGAIVLLLGDPGSGKAHLAEQAARALAEELGSQLDVVALPLPPHPSSGVASVFAPDFPGALGLTPRSDGAEPSEEPAAIAQRLLEQLVAGAPGREAILVASDVDEYAPRDIFLLEYLARDPRLRIIATAHQLTAVLERVTRGPRARKISVGPLDVEESARYLCLLLGVERIETETLRRWHAVSRGNAYALTTLALASDRSGVLRRTRGTAWVAEDDDEVPGEFADLLAGTCSAEERDALELIALAEPVLETALLRSLDAGCVSTLFERGLVLSRPRPGGGISLVSGHPLLAASLRAGLSPVRRIQLNDWIFRVLDEDRGELDPVHMPERLVRLVVFGLEGGHTLPFPWLWAAFELTGRSGDPRVVLRLALAVATHADADPTQAGAAALNACRLARIVGDDAILHASLRVVRTMLADAERRDAMSDVLRIGLQTTLIRQGVWDDAAVDQILEELDQLECALPEGDETTREQVSSSRVLVLAYTGRIREAALSCPDPVPSSDLKTEWIRSPARAVASLILEQQGALARAIGSAQNARMLSQLGSRVRADFVDIQGFCWLIGYWVGGSAEAARQVLAELETSSSAQTQAIAHYSGLVEAGSVLLDVQEGRWREAAQSAERLLVRLARHDGYGISPLVQAALALALAVLGERDAAVKALRAAETQRRGIGMVLGGHRLVLALRARQWLRSGDVLGTAERLVRWARQEDLALIELQALHAVVFESRSATPESLERARDLARTIDPPLGEAFVEHMERIAAAPAGGSPDEDESEVRMLAQLGTWLPLPPAPNLTAREREIALLATLGYSSRFIAERLHISARTVETHLAHIFAKLGVENREELWRWAARARTASLLGDT